MGKLYISKLYLKNIKCFGEITIHFSSTNDVYKWGVILGDNGLGKTTILRSIAMSLVGKASVAGLTDELYGEWIREGEDNGLIRLEIKSEDKNKKHYFITTEFIRTKDAPIEIKQKTDPEKNFPWDDFFVCGYGACRGTLGSKMYQEYFMPDSVYTLFNYEAMLQNPELVIRRIIGSVKPGSNELSKKILHWIEHILMFPKDTLTLVKKGLVTRSDFCFPSMPLIALGDGHQATATWISDLLGWALFFDETMFQKDITGIVLLDEIEQHLHPSWQKAIIKRINDCFPKIQFIITTHSPLCAIGTTDLRDEQCTLALLTRDEKGCSRVHDELNPPRGRRADQVLTSYLFGLTTSGDNATIHKIERYSDLMSRGRTPEEEEEVQTLRNELDERLGTEETKLQQLVAQSIQKVLEKKLKSSSIDQKAIDYEIKRQLRELFGDNK